MTRQAMVRELEAAGCVLLRHAKRHDIYRNPINGQQAPVPWHREIAETLCAIIRRQLGLHEATDVSSRR